MKKCPFCAEEIQDEAIKCKHCGEMLNKARPVEMIDVYKKTGKKLQLIGMLMMIGGVLGCMISAVTNSNYYLVLLGSLIAIIGFIVAIVGRFKE